jgi:hypothetical protein
MFVAKATKRFVVSRCIGRAVLPAWGPPPDNEKFLSKWGIFFVVSRCIGRLSHFCDGPPPDTSGNYEIHWRVMGSYV